MVLATLLAPGREPRPHCVEWTPRVRVRQRDARGAVQPVQALRRQPLVAWLAPDGENAGGKLEALPQALPLEALPGAQPPQGRKAADAAPREGLGAGP